MAFRWRDHLRNMQLKSLMSLTTATSMTTSLSPRWMQVLMSLSMRWDSAERAPAWARLCVCVSYISVSHYLSVCVHVVQIVEYEDYENTTDYYQENEYEYEEEYDERYGPAEREREYTLNTQVQSKLSCTKILFRITRMDLLKNITLCPFSSPTLMLFISLYHFLSLGYTRERTERRARLFGCGEENTHQLEHTHTKPH